MPNGHRRARSAPANVDVSPYGECFTVDIGGEPVLLFHGGWGKISAAASAKYTIGTWQPQVLINLGTCGGIAGRVQPGETLLVTRTIVYDILEGIGDSDDAIRAYTTQIDAAWLGDDFRLPSGSRCWSLVTAIWCPHTSLTSSIGTARRAAPRYRVVILRTVSDLVDAERNEAEAIGNLPLFQERCDSVMRSLLADLSRVVPHVLRRFHEPQSVTD